jgi:hypothetical protein
MKDKLRAVGLPLLLCLIISALYTLPTFNGKIHSQSDVNQGLLSLTEANKYKERDGHLPYWTNAIFSGMPTTLIGGRPSDNLIAKTNYIFLKALYPYRIMAVNMIGFMILLLALGITPWLAAGGAIAYSFATYSISSIEAAHYTKCLAMGLMPAILGGLIMIMKRNYLWGLFTTAFSLSLQIYYFHYQITYYTAILIGIFAVFFAYQMIRERDLKHLVIGGTLALLAGALGVVSNINKLKTTSEYAEQSMRGGSALAKEDTDPATGPAAEVGSDGLNRKYAFGWSYGLAETFTFIIPGFEGRSSTENVGGRSSGLYEDLTAGGADPGQAKEFSERAPTYFGDLPFTSGPVYMGAAIMFLFVLSLFVVKDSIRWPIIAALVVSVFLAWGRNFALLNDFLFDNLPYYNKFRTPMMALTIAQVMIPLMALLGLQKWLSNDVKPADKLSSLKKAGLITGGFVLLFGFIGSYMREFSSAEDGQMQAFLSDALQSARASMVRKDSLRSLLFIGLSFGLLWYWIKGSIKDKMLHYGIMAIMLLDLGGLAWHYLGWKDYKFKYRLDPIVEQTQADEQIMADRDPHFRVFELTPNRDPFSDNRGAKFHKLINGYHPAKLSVYQDLILNHLGKNNPAVLDMLNCKYYIGYDDKGQAAAQLRPTALGNAWFVNKLRWVADPRSEINALKAGTTPQDTIADSMPAPPDTDFKPVFEAVAQKMNGKLNNEQILGNATEFRLDSGASIKLSSYHPDSLRYKTNNSAEGLAVFSELYYPGWRAYLDGKEVPYGRVNYALRSLKIPAGSHEVLFVFAPEKEHSYGQMELATSVFILLLLPAAFILGKKKDQDLA